MRKTLLITVIVLLTISGLVFGQQKKIYNDGEIDYVPMSAKFVLDAQDDESSLKEIQYSVDGGPIKMYKGPISFSTEGRHVIAYRAIDQTGNISNETFYSCIVDATPPIIGVSANGPAYVLNDKAYLTSKTSIILSAEDDLSGLSAIYVSLDGGSYIRYTGAAFITEEGVHSGKAYAMDNVGNKTKTYIVEGVIDNTPPRVSIMPKERLIDMQGSKYTSSTNQFSISASDVTSGVKEILVSIDRGEYFTYVEPFKIQKPGFHSIRAKALDYLDNVSSVTEITFNVDVNKPKANLQTVIE